MNHYKKLLLLGILTVIFLHAQSEGEKLSVATYRTLYSHILDEERTVVISVPAGYDYSKQQYPVLYMLDAEYADFAWSVGLVHYLGAYQMPEMIIVGVLNTNRNRDMWSYKIEGLANTTDDGAENFMNFFARELIPFVDQNYRTTSYRVIYGRSAGGHFVTYCLFAQPDLFDAYLASSPVIGFSNDNLLRQAEKFFSKHKSSNRSFFIYYGDTDYNSVVKRIPVLEQIIQENTPDGFTWGVKRVAGRHGPPKSLHELLLMLFPDWTPVSSPVITPSRAEMV
ncbi:MAG: alpha/beta hydrolase, partial [candidate division WOR-3 bacterium]